MSKNLCYHLNTLVRWALVKRMVFSSWSKYTGSPQTVPFHSNPFCVKLTWYTVEGPWIHMHAGQKHSSSPSWDWHLIQLTKSLSQSLNWIARIPLSWYCDYGCWSTCIMFLRRNQHDSLFTDSIVFLKFM